MRKNIFCIIATMLILNTIIAAGVIANSSEEIDRTPIISEKQDDNWIPTIAEVNASVGFDGRFNCVLTGYDDVTVNNWTNSSQKVKIKWKVQNDGDKEGFVTVHVRIREWIAPLSVAIFFGFARYGNIGTKHRRNEKITIPLKKGYHENETEINITINNKTAKIEGAAFMWVVHPRMNGFFNFEWSTININPVQT